MSEKENIASLLVLAVLTASAFSFSSAMSAEEKKQTEKDVVLQFISTVTRTDSMATRKNTFNDAAVHMDFNEMAKRAFGDSGWATFSTADQKEVTQLFRQMLQNRYFVRWRRVFSDGKYEVKSTNKDKKEASVIGLLKLSGKKSDVNFRLVETADGPKIISMVVSGKDLLERTSIRLKRALKNKGAKGLIAYLKKRTAEKSADFNQVPSPDELISGSK